MKNNDTLGDDIRELNERLERVESFIEVWRARGVRKIELALANLAVRTAHEHELQAAVYDRLLQYAIPFQEQYVVSKTERYDFAAYVHPEAKGCKTWMDPVKPIVVCLELKVKGGLAPLIRQLDRYSKNAGNSGAKAIVVVTTKRQLLRVPTELNGIQVRAVCAGTV